MKRVARPADIAGAIVFLVSPLAAYITGQVIPVDGGASIKYPLPLVG
jgi:NAD(P)-dependent dehydrogenase (short-subunit alcohol dehydrogenase family)